MGTHINSPFITPEIKIENLNYVINSGPYYPFNAGTSNKHILHNINATIRYGHLSVLLGSSGSGKTSLLNILAQRINSGKKFGLLGTSTHVVTGNISYPLAEVEISHEKRQEYMRGASPTSNHFLNEESTQVKFVPSPNNSDQLLRVGYVKQYDFLLPYYSVRECLEMIAKLTLPELTDQEREERIVFVLSRLGLLHCQHTLIGSKAQNIGGLSGGEARRLSIAIQLLKDPQVLFCDEITTGLDSSSSLQIIQLLSQLTKALGMTIIVALHQPRNDLFHLFDDLLLLARGYVVYNGTLRQKSISNYFSKIGYPCPQYTNISDFIIDICAVDSRDPVRTVTSIDRVQFLIQQWLNHVNNNQTNTNNTTINTSHNSIPEIQNQPVVTICTTSPILSSEFDTTNTNTTTTTTTATTTTTTVINNTPSHPTASTISLDFQPNHPISQHAPILFPTTSKFKQPRPTNPWSQFKQLSKRFLLSMIRDKLAITGIFLQSLILAFCVGFLFFQLGTDLNDIRMRVSLMYLVNTIVPYVSLILQIYMQTLELILFDNEQEEKLYYAWVYGLARLAVFFPIVCFVALISSTIMGFMARIRGAPGYNSLYDQFNPVFGNTVTLSGNVGDFLLWLVFGGIVPYMFVLALSMFVTSLSRSFSTASLIANSLYTILSFSCGYFIKDEAIPDWIQWTKYISYIYHSFHALITIQFYGQNFPCPEFDPTDPNTATSPVCIQYTGQYLLQYYGALEPYRPWIVYHFLIIVLISSFFVLLSILALTFLQPNNMAMSIAKKDLSTRLERMVGSKQGKITNTLDDNSIARTIAYLDFIHAYPPAYKNISQQLFISMQRQLITMHYQKTILSLAQQLQPSLFIHNYPHLDIVKVEVVDPTAINGKNEKEFINASSTLDYQTLHQQLFLNGILSNFKNPLSNHCLNPSIQLPTKVESTTKPTQQQRSIFIHTDSPIPQPVIIIPNQDDNDDDDAYVNNDSNNNMHRYPQNKSMSLSKPLQLQRSQSSTIASSPRSSSQPTSSFFKPVDDIIPDHNGQLPGETPPHSIQSCHNLNNNDPKVDTTNSHTNTQTKKSNQSKPFPFEHRICPNLTSIQPMVLRELLLQELLDFNLCDAQLVCTAPNNAKLQSMYHSSLFSPSQTDSVISTLSDPPLPQFGHDVPSIRKNSTLPSLSHHELSSTTSSQCQANQTSPVCDLNTTETTDQHHTKIIPQRLARRGGDGIMLEQQFAEKTIEIHHKNKQDAENAQKRLQEQAKKWKIISEDEFNQATTENDANGMISATPYKRKAQGPKITRTTRSNQGVVNRMSVDRDWENHKDLVIQENVKKWKFWFKWSLTQQQQYNLDDTSAHNNPKMNTSIQKSASNNTNNNNPTNLPVNNQLHPQYQHNHKGTMSINQAKQMNIVIDKFSLLVPIANPNFVNRIWKYCVKKIHHHDDDDGTKLNTNETNPPDQPQVIEPPQLFTQHAIDNESLFDSLLLVFPCVSDDGVKKNDSHGEKNFVVPPQHQSIIDQCLPPLPDFLLSPEHLNNSTFDQNLYSLGQFSPSQLFASMTHIKQHSLPIQDLPLNTHTAQTDANNHPNSTNEINNNFDWEHKHSQQQISLVKSLSTTMRAGTSWVILGASGSGKTSLLRYLVNQLSTKSYDVVGDVFFSQQIEKELENQQQNQHKLEVTSSPKTTHHEPSIEGLDIRTSFEPYQNSTNLVTIKDTITYPHEKMHTNQYVGYLSQHATLLPQLTVIETLMMVAQFALHYLPKTTRKNRVLEVIRQLNLSDCQNSIIGGGGTTGNENVAKSISGGQKKLLCLGLVLLLNPPIWLADEPTSGLDAFSSSICCDLLVNLARGEQKRLVVATLHQPRFDVFSKFDNVIVLAKSNVIYAGSINNLVPYFHSIPFIPRINAPSTKNNNNNNNNNKHKIESKITSLTPEFNHDDDESNETNQSPADWVLDLVAIDFSLNKNHTLATIKRIIVMAKIFWYRQQHIKYQVHLLVRTINLHKLSLTRGNSILQNSNQNKLEYENDIVFPDGWNHDPAHNQAALNNFTQWINFGELNDPQSHTSNISSCKTSQLFCPNVELYNSSEIDYSAALNTTSHVSNLPTTNIKNQPSSPRMEADLSDSALVDSIQIKVNDNNPMPEMKKAVDSASPLQLVSPQTISDNCSPYFPSQFATMLGGEPNSDPINHSIDPDQLTELIVCRYCGVIFSLTTLNLPCVAILHRYHMDLTSPYAMINEYLLTSPQNMVNLCNQIYTPIHQSPLSPAPSNLILTHTPSQSPTQRTNSVNSIISSGLNILNVASPIAATTTAFRSRNNSSASSHISLQPSSITSWESSITTTQFNDDSEPTMELNSSIKQDIKQSIKSPINHNTFYNLREFSYKLNAQFHYQQAFVKNTSQIDLVRKSISNVTLNNNPTQGKNKQDDKLDLSQPSQQFTSLLKSIPVSHPFTINMAQSPLVRFQNKQYTPIYAQIQLIQALLLSNYHSLNSPHHRYYLKNKTSPQAPVCEINDPIQSNPLIHQFIRLVVYKPTYERSLRLLEKTIQAQYNAMLDYIATQTFALEDQMDTISQLCMNYNLDLIHTYNYYYQKQCLQGVITNTDHTLELNTLQKIRMSMSRDKIKHTSIDVNGINLDENNNNTHNSIKSLPSTKDISHIDTNTHKENNNNEKFVSLTNKEKEKLSNINKKFDKCKTIPVEEQFKLAQDLSFGPGAAHDSVFNIMSQNDTNDSPPIPTNTTTIISKHPPFWTSYKILLFRQIKHGLRQPDLFFTRFSQIVAFSVILCLFFAQLPYNLTGLYSRMGSYSLLLSATSVGILNSISLFPQERNMYYYEAHTDMSLYQPFAFMLSYSTIELVWTSFSSLIAAVILAFVIDYTATTSFWRFIVLAYIIASMATFGETLAMLFCVIFFHVGFTISLVTTLISLFDISAGIIAVESNLIWPVRILNKLSLHWYAVRILALSDLYGHPVQCDPTDQANPCIYTNATQFLETYDIAVWWQGLWALILIVFLLNVMYRIIVFFILAQHVPVISTGGAGGGGGESDSIDIDLLKIRKGIQLGNQKQSNLNNTQCGNTVTSSKTEDECQFIQP